MSKNAIEKAGNNGKAVTNLDEEWSLTIAALERLDQVDKRDPPPARREARLIFGLDLTGSREPSLCHARVATASMFDTIKVIGSVAVKLVYYRGSECRIGDWHDDPAIVSRYMMGLSCKAGRTQIARMLKRVLAEREKVSGMVFVGDHCEEDGWGLDDLAVRVGERGIPIFIFHEVRDDDELALHAQSLFQHLAKVSGGVYTEFKPDAGEALRELLATIAAFSAAGHEGLKQIAQPVTPEARQLRSGLALLPARPEDAHGARS